MDRFFHPVIEIADMERRLLSFLNLFEAYICDPFTRSTRPPEAPRVVVIDPRVLYGRPVIAGTRVPTAAVVYERWKAGESVETLAVDYSRSRDEIEEALRCEHAQAA